MSFFGIDSSKPPKETHNAKAPGFGPTPDPFAGLSGGNAGDDDDDALDFEDTYDGLGGTLEESGDALNDATFGGSGPVSKDFDFAGQSVVLSLTQDQPTQQPMRGHPSKSRPPEFVRPPSPPKATSKPAKTGYERYSSKGGPIPNLAATASIWQQPNPPPQARQHAPPSHQPSLPTATKKMMSLEEVEAAMRSQTKPTRPSASPQPEVEDHLAYASNSSALPPFPQNGTGQRSAQLPVVATQPQILQRPAQNAKLTDATALREELPAATYVPTSHPVAPAHGSTPPFQFPPPSQPETLQTSKLQRPSPQPQMPPMSQGPLPSQPMPSQMMPLHGRMHSRGQSIGGRVVSHPDELLQMPEEERAKLLLEDANRAKRNHKIHMLSRENGLMTPQDKNFITRIQLQQLVTATGGAEDQGADANLAEDFYFQVYSQIRGAPRQDDNFTQTYLSELAWRGRNRRYPRGGENHMRRMEQQVQRAVEAAKARPKNKQLVVEGSLGKISFSNAKTPKPLLNLKRQESQDAHAQMASRNKVHESVAGRKAVLRDIEALYGTLMRMEDHERRMPPPPNEESSGDEIQGHMEWRQRIQELNQTLWNELKVLEPIVPNSPTPHPFVAILSHPKGKKLIPRVFRQIDDQQRLTILTIIDVQLDQIDVIRLAQPAESEIELFSQAVMPCMFAYIGDAGLDIVTGLVGLMTEKTNMLSVAQSKPGINFLLMFLSRAQMIKQAGSLDDSEVAQWSATFNRLFDTLEPLLPTAFSGVDSRNDQYIWQFLASMGIESSQDQQQRLVIAVKDKVMETVGQAKALPEEDGKPQLDNVNLFMHAIGLDVDLLG